MTGEGQSIVNRFIETVEKAKVEAKDAAGTVGSDFAEIMGIIDNYVAVVPKKLSKAEMRFAKVGKFFGAILRRVEDLFQMIDGPNGKFSPIRAIAVLSAVVAVIEVFKGNDLRAAGCGVVTGLAVWATAFETAAFTKKTQIVQPKGTPGMPAEGVQLDYGDTPPPGQFMGKTQ